MYILYKYLDCKTHPFVTFFQTADTISTASHTAAGRAAGDAIGGGAGGGGGCSVTAA